MLFGYILSFLFPHARPRILDAFAYVLDSRLTKKVINRFLVLTLYHTKLNIQLMDFNSVCTASYTYTDNVLIEIITSCSDPLKYYTGYLIDILLITLLTFIIYKFLTR